MGRGELGGLDLGQLEERLVAAGPDDLVGEIEAILRRLLGIDAKLAQYRNGSAFVGAVVDKVGMDGFNAIWTSPETLPLPAEIAAPEAWVARVHG